MLYKKIIFRADGNANTGLGHLYRLFSLVEVVKEEIDFVFLTREDSTLEIFPESYNYEVIPNHIKTEDEPNWLIDRFSSDDFIIIADGYQFASNFQNDIKERGYKLIYVDDLAKEHMFADIVINHSPYIRESDFYKEKYVKLALGTSYALLRPAFLKAAAIEIRKINKLNSVFVCFGGSDPLNLSLKATKALLKFDQIKDIHIVLGAANMNSDIFELQELNNDKIYIYRNISESELINLMVSCNFAIAPASTILFELCCVKIPILTGFFVDNQELIYKGFVEKEAVYGGGDFNNYEEDDFERNIEVILNSSDYSREINSQKCLFDNQIAERHLNLIKQLCKN